jgi:hypothetical protein
MGTTTFTGPIKAGNVLNTTGTTPGTVKNVGFTVMAQTAPITQAGTANATATTIVIPAYSHILQIQVLTSVGWTGNATTISLGANSSANQFVSGGNLTSIGINALTPGTNATLVGNWSNVGTTDVIIYAQSANTGNGTGDLVVRYVQAENA